MNRLTKSQHHIEQSGNTSTKTPVSLPGTMSPSHFLPSPLHTRTGSILLRNFFDGRRMLLISRDWNRSMRCLFVLPSGIGHWRVATIGIVTIVESIPASQCNVVHACCGYGFPPLLRQGIQANWVPSKTCFVFKSSLSVDVGFASLLT
jgi:hypothetical protein